jgi:hypothetical protein
MNKPNINLGAILDLINNKVIVNDNTDYVDLGLNEADISISLELHTPIGLLYINSDFNDPSIAPDLFGATRTFEYPNLPLLSNGCFIQGHYSVRANLLYIPTNEIFTYNFQQIIDYSKKDIKISQEIDCFCAKFSSIDETNYSASEENTYTQTINYPSETNEADNVYGGKIFTENRLANGVYVTEVETERYWIYGANFKVLDINKGKATIQVDCSGMCEIKCSFNKLWDKYSSACGKNKEKADEFLALLSKATSLLSLINLNRKCGEVRKSDSLINELKDLLGNCDCGCGGCNEDDDVWVTGICGSGIIGNAFDYVFQSCNNLINVTSSTNSGVITYTICLNKNALMVEVESKFNVLIAPILANLDWFQGLDTACLVGFPNAGTQTAKKQYLIDKICQIASLVIKPPVAKNDFISTTQGQAVSILVTMNDFFSSNVVATITTPANNGTAVVGIDGKTITYTPTLPTFVGIDTFTYTITDADGQTSSAVVTVTVNPTNTVGCNVINPALIVDAKPTNNNKVQFVIQNATQYNGNIQTSEQYIVNVYDITNTILQSYNVSGSISTDPTFYTSIDDITNDWNYYKVQLLTSSQSPSGVSCGSVVWETEPYSLTDINTDIFAGTTAPCLAWLPTDSQYVKMQKLLTKVCTPIVITINTTNGLSGDGAIGSPVKLGGVLTEPTTINANNYIFKISSTNAGKFFSEKVRLISNLGDENNAGLISYNTIATEIFSPPALGQTYMLNTDIRNNIFETKIINANNDIITHSYPNLFRWGAIVNTHMAFDISNTIGGVVKDMVNLKLGGIFKNNILTGDTLQNYCSLYIEQIKAPYPEPNVTNSYAIYQAGINDINALFGATIIGGNAVSPLQPTAKLHVIGLATKTAGATWTVASDRRLKKDIKDYTLGLKEVLGINIKTFKYNGELGTEKSEKDIVGVIADEIVKILPNTITETKVSEDEKPYMSFDANELLFLYTNAIKELNTIIEKQKEDNKEKFNHVLSMIENLTKENEMLSNEIELLKSMK